MLTLRVLWVVLCACVAGTSFAEGKVPQAKFALQLPMLRYTSSSVKRDSPANGSTSGTATELQTQVLDDGFIGISLGKLAFYIYPFNDGNHFGSVGYMVLDNVEIGADIGLNSANDPVTKRKSESTLLGLWGYHYSSLGAFGLENGLSLSNTSKNEQNAPDASVKSSEVSIKLASSVTYPLMRNLKYVGGVFIKNKSLEVDGGDKTKTLQIGLILAGLRLRWE